MINAYRASDDEKEMIKLAHAMTQLHHDHASFIPAFYQPFYRLGHWRWLKYPEGFNHKHSGSAGEFFVHWIDKAVKEETMSARESGVTFAPEIKVYDQFK
jgi:microcin C transport system substrate-binding protein